MGDRILVDAPKVARMVARQFPRWAHLPVTPVARSGWDNHTFHLGPAMKIRLPSAERYAAQVEKENRHLPLLARSLPLPIPEPLGIGRPDADFAWSWSVQSWIAGETASRERIADMAGFGRDLGLFLSALQRVDARQGPQAGTHNFHRGGDLAVYDAEAQRCIAALGGRIDGPAALAVWQEALASRCTEPPVWVHGDIAVGNLLVREGRLSAVIDFGSCGTGDPACDLVIAWLFLDGPGRVAFRSALPHDAATWARARGWALWKAALMAAQDQGSHPEEQPPLLVIEALIAERRGLARP